MGSDGQRAVRALPRPALTVSRRRVTFSMRFSRCWESGYLWTCGPEK